VAILITFLSRYRYRFHRLRGKVGRFKATTFDFGCCFSRECPCFATLILSLCQKVLYSGERMLNIITEYLVVALPFISIQSIVKHCKIAHWQWKIVPSGLNSIKGTASSYWLNNVKSNSFVAVLDMHRVAQELVLIFYLKKNIYPPLVWKVVSLIVLYRQY